jgi:hypothetical protein
MDQAWALEQSFWRELCEGDANGFYRRHMAADGFIVLPNRLVSRNELVARSDALEPLRECTLSEPTFTVVEGGNVVITYQVSADADWLPKYSAWMTALYTWGSSEWTLVFRAHTPGGAAAGPTPPI